MNNTQVAKVVYAAQTALDETNAVTPAAGKWEDLTDHQRSEVANDVSGHVSGAEKQVNSDLVAQGLQEKDRLKYYLSSGIVEAFRRYEKSLDKQNSASVGASSSVREAMAKADSDIAAHNASGAAQTDTSAKD